MDVRMVVTAVGGVADGPKLVNLAAAPAEEGVDDPNMEFTKANTKPVASATVYVSHPDKSADKDFPFVEGNVYNVSFTAISEMERVSKPLRMSTPSSPNPNPTPGSGISIKPETPSPSTHVEPTKPA